MQEFLELDSLDFEAYFGARRPRHAGSRGLKAFADWDQKVLSF